VLILTNNQLKALPERLVELENLEMLILSNNQLTSLPTNLEAMKNLKTLIAINNPFSEEEKQRIRAALPDCKVYL
jgi:leucine-rich repeat protein SHOC2